MTQVLGKEFGLVHGALPWRGLGAVGGFMVEVPAFTTGTKAATWALGNEVDISKKAWKAELIGGAWVLGSLKAGAALFGGAVNLGHGVKTVPTRGIALYPTSRTLGAQAGMFSGIMAGHHLEAGHLGHDMPDGSLAVLEGLVTLFQFNVAGRMLHHGTPGLQRASQKLNLAVSQLTPLPIGEGPGVRGPQLAHAIVGNPSTVPPSPPACRQAGNPSPPTGGRGEEELPPILHRCP